MKWKLFEEFLDYNFIMGDQKWNKKPRNPKGNYTFDYISRNLGKPSVKLHDRLGKYFPHKWQIKINMANIRRVTTNSSLQNNHTSREHPIGN